MHQVMNMEIKVQLIYKQKAQLLDQKEAAIVPINKLITQT
jgi:hypothetical protein